MKKVKLKKRPGMTIMCFDDSYELTEFCYNWMVETINTISPERIFIPAGKTPICLYQLMEKNPKDIFKDITFVQIDDIITKPYNGMFREFFSDHLPSFVNQIEFISEFNENPRGADMAVLGLGLNGHVAFHEPHLDQDFSFGRVNLSSQTVSQLEIDSDAVGISYGLGMFMQTKRALMISKGCSKASITAKFLSGDIELPASKLLGHPDFTLAVDREAISLIDIDKIGN